MIGFKQPFSAVVAAAALTLSFTAPAGADGNDQREPIVIGHRGASGYVPEHTLASYYIAIQQGADFIEPDLVMTRDGVLVARHENDITGTTNVADKPEFADRKATKTVDGEVLTGWFTEDFTLTELKTLRAKERLPQIRPGNARLDGSLEIPTFEEILALVDAVNGQRRQPIGIYPETKHPTYFANLGLVLEEPLVDLLHSHGYVGRHAPIFIQSFEVGNLKKLAKMTRLPLIQLLGDSDKPYDFVVSGDPRNYADLVKPAGLQEIAGYAQGIGPSKTLIIPSSAEGNLGAPTTLVSDAHAAGLVVHAYTFRRENFFLPKAFQSSADPGAYGDLDAEIKRYLDLGMDGFFTDQPNIGVRARNAFVGK